MRDILAKSSPPRRWGVTNSRDHQVWWVSSDNEAATEIYLTSVEVGFRAASLLCTNSDYYNYMRGREDA